MNTVVRHAEGFGNPAGFACFDLTCSGLPAWKPMFSITQQLHLRAKRTLFDKRCFEMSCITHNRHRSL